MVLTRRQRAEAAAAAAAASDADSDVDSVDDHVARRHARLQEQARGSDSESEAGDAGFGGEKEAPVCDIGLSSSEDDEEESVDEVLQKPSKANLKDSDAEDSEDEGDDEDDDDEKWRGRRAKNYGADTHEHEIMEDDEREAALAAEEEEAARLQDKSIAGLTAADYAPEGSSDEEEGDDVEVMEVGEMTAAGAEVAGESASELAALAKECEKYHGLSKQWGARTGWGAVAQTRFQLYSAYATNLAFYFAVRTDPEEEGTDVREHPVVKRIVQIRKLMTEHEGIDVEEPAAVVEEAVVAPVVERDEDAALQGPQKAVDDDEAPVEAEATEAPKRLKERKKGKKKRKKAARGAANGDAGEKDDEGFVQSLLQRSCKPDDADSVADAAAEKRRRLNQITGAIDSESKNASKRRVASADADHFRVRTEKRGTIITPEVADENTPGDVNGLDELDDSAFVDRILQKKKKNVDAVDVPKKKKKQKEAPHHYSFKDTADPTARRRASTQVVLNKGLARYRPKEKKTPRTKNKIAYANAVKRRKGMVREAVAVQPGTSYGGEASGINVNARRGARLSDV